MLAISHFSESDDGVLDVSRRIKKVGDGRFWNSSNLRLITGHVSRNAP
jgi:hypothetical protein